MKPLLLLLLSAASLVLAQAAGPALSVSGPLSVPIGQPGTITVSVSGSAGASLAGIQWTITPATGVTFGTPAISSSAASLGMGVYCNPANGTCVVVGATNATPPVLSTNALTDMIVATIPVTLSGLATGSTVPFAMPTALGASTAGTPVTVAPSVTFTLTAAAALSHCDYNGDGTVSATDASALIQALIGTSTCSPTFVAGCSLTSLEAVVKAALGQACSL